MATHKTRDDLEKARDGAELRAALKAANDKVVKLKCVILGGNPRSVYVTGEIDKALLDEITERGSHKQMVTEFSVGVSGGNAYVSGIDEKTFFEDCRRAGIRLTSVRKVDNVAAALRAAPGG
jgi:hypothetical protein